MGRKYGYMKPSLAPTERATVHDIIWAAGIYEGEGSCNPNTQATVVQKDMWLLYRLQELFGGSISSNSNGSHQWLISGARARGFLMSIYGLLSPYRQNQITKSLRKQNNII